MTQSRRSFVKSAFGVTAAAGLGFAGATWAQLRRPIPPGLREPVKKVDLEHVTIFADPQYSCCEPSLAILPNRDVVATFQQTIMGHDTGNILLVRSRDNGKTWDHDNPVTVFARGEDHGHNLAGLTQLSDGTLIACTMQWQFLFEGRHTQGRGSGMELREELGHGLSLGGESEIEGLYVKKSTDGGHTWGKKIKVNIAPFRIAYVRDSILEMPDGTLLLPLCGLRQDRYDSTATRETLKSFLLRSIDGGDSWHYWGLMGMDPAGIRTLEEPGITRLADGRLLAMMRSHNRPRRDPPGGYLYQAVSEDGGATFSQAKRTEMWGYPADLITLKDGRVVCTYSYRMYPNPGVRGCVSDDGISWKPENIFVVRADPDLSSQFMHIGYPSSEQLEDGTILTAYHIWHEGKALGYPGPEAGWKQYVEGALYRL